MDNLVEVSRLEYFLTTMKTKNIDKEEYQNLTIWKTNKKIIAKFEKTGKTSHFFLDSIFFEENKWY